MLEERKRTEGREGGKRKKRDQPNEYDKNDYHG